MLLKRIILTILLFSGSVGIAAKESLHLIIHNATIVDGSGAESYKASIGIRGDTIVRIGDLDDAEADRRIDATGHIVSPGFIDLHSHSDRDLIVRPDATNIITQGVTTLLGGNCGGSPVDMAEFLEILDVTDISLNMGMLIGHNSVRRKIMQRDNRHATADEMAQMKKLVDDAMRAGAYGMSSGLIYIPGTFSPPEETQELARVVAEHKGFYATHMRTEGKRVVEAVQEAVDVAQQTGIHVHISHHKAAGPDAWGLSKQTLALIDTSRADGLDVTLDQYPYTASNTNLGVLMPSWSLAGGQKAFVKRMADPETRAKIKEEVIQILDSQRSGKELWRIQISSYRKNPELEGLNFEQVLQQRGLELTQDNAAELAMELQLNGGGRGIYHTMQDEDVERIMRHPYTSIASDGRGTTWQIGNPHPRNYGTYPRVLAHYVREKGVLSIPEAVRKMTSMPAKVMGLDDRGLLKTGYKADIAIWDPESIQDNSTFTDPHNYSTGMQHVIVNGVVVLADGEMTANRPGVALRRRSD